jgi:mevalonate kinase
MPNIESDLEGLLSELHRKSVIHDAHIALLTGLVKGLARHCIEDKEAADSFIEQMEKATKQLVEKLEAENFVVINNSLQKSLDELKDIPGIDFS